MHDSEEDNGQEHCPIEEQEDEFLSPLIGPEQEEEVGLHQRCKGISDRFVTISSLSFPSVSTPLVVFYTGIDC